jgi:hypothetical protein
MKSHGLRAYSTFKKRINLPITLTPAKGNFVAVYYWSPGYKVLVDGVSKDGKSFRKKIFQATTSLEAALAHLKSYYGSQEFLKFKGDAHPGHISMSTSQNYLSIGAEVATLTEVGFNTQHNAIFGESLQADCISFMRLPEKTIDLHSLKVSKINNHIKSLRNPNFKYNVLGGRFGTFGDSCATSCYGALLKGGLSGFLRADQAYLSQLKVLTPRNFISYIEIAKLNEQGFFPSVVELSKEFLVSHDQHMQEIRKRIEVLNEEDQNILALTNETNSNKPK